MADRFLAPSFQNPPRHSAPKFGGERLSPELHTLRLMQQREKQCSQRTIRTADPRFLSLQPEMPAVDFKVEHRCTPKVEPIKSTKVALAFEQEEQEYVSATRINTKLQDYIAVQQEVEQKKGGLKKGAGEEDLAEEWEDFDEDDDDDDGKGGKGKRKRNPHPRGFGPRSAHPIPLSQAYLATNPHLLEPSRSQINRSRRADGSTDYFASDPPLPPGTNRHPQRPVHLLLAFLAGLVGQTLTAHYDEYLSRLPSTSEIGLRLDGHDKDHLTAYFGAVLSAYQTDWKPRTAKLTPRKFGPRAGPVVHFTELTDDHTVEEWKASLERCTSPSWFARALACGGTAATSEKTTLKIIRDAVDALDKRGQWIVATQPYMDPWTWATIEHRYNKDRLLYPLPSFQNDGHLFEQSVILPFIRAILRLPSRLGKLIQALAHRHSPEHVQPHLDKERPAPQSLLDLIAPASKSINAFITKVLIHHPVADATPWADNDGQLRQLLEREITSATPRECTNMHRRIVLHINTILAKLRSRVAHRGSNASLSGMLKQTSEHHRLIDLDHYLKKQRDPSSTGGAPSMNINHALIDVGSDGAYKHTDVAAEVVDATLVLLNRLLPVVRDLKPSALSRAASRFPDGTRIPWSQLLHNNLEIFRLACFDGACSAPDFLSPSTSQLLVKSAVWLRIQRIFEGQWQQDLPSSGTAGNKKVKRLNGAGGLAQNYFTHTADLPPHLVLDSSYRVGPSGLTRFAFDPTRPRSKKWDVYMPPSLPPSALDTLTPHELLSSAIKFGGKSNTAFYGRGPGRGLDPRDVPFRLPEWRYYDGAFHFMDRRPIFHPDAPDDRLRRLSSRTMRFFDPWLDGDIDATADLGGMPPGFISLTPSRSDPDRQRRNIDKVANRMREFYNLPSPPASTDPIPSTPTDSPSPNLDLLPFVNKTNVHANDTGKRSPLTSQMVMHDRNGNRVQGQSVVEGIAMDQSVRKQTRHSHHIRNRLTSTSTKHNGLLFLLAHYSRREQTRRHKARLGREARIQKQAEDLVAAFRIQHCTGQAKMTDPRGPPEQETDLDPRGRFEREEYNAENGNPWIKGYRHIAETSEKRLTLFLVGSGVYARARGRGARYATLLLRRVVRLVRLIARRNGLTVIFVLVPEQRTSIKCCAYDCMVDGERSQLSNVRYIVSGQECLRVKQCSKCGVIYHRDVVAAVNIHFVFLHLLIFYTHPFWIESSVPAPDE